ncbi:MAG: hypothetical protein MGAcid_15980 [uncultured Acidilobus sp. MG]|nr:MAG: hypothetical protein MGAcid_15980 [uncultured Acidilobus sp. MG]
MVVEPPVISINPFKAGYAVN